MGRIFVTHGPSPRIVLIIFEHLTDKRYEQGGNKEAHYK